MAVHSIDALLDAATDASIRAEWVALSAAGLPSRADHRGASNAPHVTLAAAEVLTGDADEALGRRFADLLPVEVRLGDLLVLGGRRHVLARGLEPTPGLLALHRAVLEGLGEAAGVSDLVLPGHWVPHVTLATRLDDEQLRAARSVLAGIRPVDARIVAVQRWDPRARTVHGLAP